MVKYFCVTPRKSTEVYEHFTSRGRADQFPLALLPCDLSDAPHHKVRTELTHFKLLSTLRLGNLMGRAYASLYDVYEEHRIYGFHYAVQFIEVSFR